LLVSASKRIRSAVLVGDRLLDLNGLLATELRDLLACWGELAEFFPGVRLGVARLADPAGSKARARYQDDLAA
jgi:hypothetical protein